MIKEKKEGSTQVHRYLLLSLRKRKKKRRIIEEKKERKKKKRRRCAILPTAGEGQKEEGGGRALAKLLKRSKRGEERKGSPNGSFRRPLAEGTGKRGEVSIIELKREQEEKRALGV